MVGRHVGEAEAPVDGVSPGAAGGDAHDGVVTGGEAGFVAAAVGVGGVDLGVDEDHVESGVVGSGLCAAGDDGVASEEVPARVEVDEPAEVGFDGGDLGGELVAPGLVGLLYAHGVHGIGAEVDHAVGFAGGDEGVVEVGHAVDGMVEFPAEFADVGHPQGDAGHAGDVDLLSGEPGEGVVAEVGVGERGEHVACPWSGDGEDPVVAGDIVDVDVLAGFDVLDQPVLVVGFAGHGGVEVEAGFAAVGVEACDGHLAFDAAGRGEHVDQAQASRADRQPVGREAVEQGGGVVSGDEELGEGGQVGDPDPVAYAPAFGGDDVEGVGASPRVAFGLAEVLGALPTPDVLPLCVEGVESVVDGGHAQGAAGGSVFAGHAYLVHLVEFVDGLVDGVVEGGPGAEAPGVHFADVDLGLAVDHPLGEVPAGAGALGDADRCADAHPVVAQAGGRAHEEAAVGGVGDGSGDGLLDAGFAEDGDAFGGEFEPRHEDVVVGWGEVEVEVPVDAFGAVGDGVGPLVGADEEGVDLAAVVARRSGVADDGHLVFAGGHGGE